MASITRGLRRQPKSTQHYAAMPYVDVAAFLVRLGVKETMGRLALAFAIVTAARSGEVRGAIWPEIDLDERLWTIPPERMKADREHIVPLSDHAYRILRRCEELRVMGTDLVFHGVKHGEPMLDMTIVKVLRDMGEGVTPHGFRSTFRDWASETTDFNDRVVEAALAHAVKDKTKAAYRRGALHEKRRFSCLHGASSAWEAMPSAKFEAHAPRTLRAEIARTLRNVAMTHAKVNELHSLLASRASHGVSPRPQGGHDDRQRSPDLGIRLPTVDR